MTPRAATRPLSALCSRSRGASSPIGPVVAGYRLDELIGVGETANVYAGALDLPRSGAAEAPDATDSVDAAARAPAGDGGPVVVKVCLGEGGGGRDAECRVLARRPIAAMPQLLDLGATGFGELILVMTLCRGRPLGSAWPPAVGGMPNGEALSRLVGELHDAGVAHGGLDPGAVLVDDDGALSLVGFRAARFAGEPGFDAAVGADLRAVATLRARARVRPVAPESMAASTSADDEVVDAWGWVDDAVEEAGPDPAFLETLEPAVLAIRESGAALRGLVRSRSAGAMAPRRRRLLAAGGALVVAAAVAGCLLVPTGGSKAAAGDAAPAGERLLASPTPSLGSRVGAETPNPGAQPGSAAEEDIRSDDVVHAATALLERRLGCLRTGEPGCLDAVDQWNSPAMLDDRELMRGSGPPGGPLGDPLASVSALTLVECIGATALLTGTAGGEDASDTTKPVSLLVMRGETGWRLRSYRVGSGPD